MNKKDIDESLKVGIIGDIARKSITSIGGLVEKLDSCMKAKLDHGAKVEDTILPYEMLAALIESFQSTVLIQDPGFAIVMEKIEGLIFNNDELQEIFHNDKRSIADYGLALIVAGGVMMSLDYNSDSVVNEKLEKGNLTDTDLKDLLDMNIQGISHETVDKIKKDFASKCNHDCKSCEHCSTNQKPDSNDTIKGTLPDNQREALYSLINDKQITSDTIHNLITSGAVTINELKANIESSIFNKLMEGVSGLVSQQIKKSGNFVTETTDRNILKYQKVTEAGFKNSLVDVLDSIDAIIPVSDLEKGLRERILNGNITNQEIFDAISNFRINPLFVEKHLSSERKIQIGEMLVKKYNK